MKKRCLLFLMIFFCVLCLLLAGCSKITVVSVEKFNAKLSSLKNYPNLSLVSDEKKGNFYTHRIRVTGMDSRDAKSYKEYFPEDIIFFSGDGAGETAVTIYTNYPQERITYLKEGI